MKHTLLTLTTALLLLLACESAVAQNRLGIEVRGGAAFATQDLADAELDVGVGFEGIVSYRFMPHLAAYGGWGWQRFPSEGNVFAGTDIDFEETGYTFGLLFTHPLGQLPLGYYVRGGGIYNHIELENVGGDITADSGHGLGWHAGAGFVVPLGSNWQLMPGVKYQALSRDIEIGATDWNTDLTYVTVGMGIMYTF